MLVAADDFVDVVLVNFPEVLVVLEVDFEADFGVLLVFEVVLLLPLVVVATALAVT